MNEIEEIKTKLEGIAGDIARRLDEPLKSEVISYYRRHRCRLVYQLHRILQEGKDEGSILEIGPYPGLVSIYLAREGYNVEVVEYPRPEMKHLEKMYMELGVNRVIYRDLAKENIGSEERYDIILMFEVIEHIPAHPYSIFRKIHEVLKRQGKLYLSTPNLLNSFNRISLLKGVEPFPLYKYSLETTKGHFREYSVQELRAAMRQAGLDMIEYKILDKEDYCRHIGENAKTSISVRISRGIIRLLGGKGPLKWSIFAVAQKGSSIE
ncbi:MAG: class I SAM-dependent methyltransferase [Desulfurococcales archaeon]|nr:class I SAM-dependent methyltransferase [Desulfurococcales archaeon]